MQISEAQRDVRQAFAGGFMGQLVSAVLWFVSAALATWGDHLYAIGVLVFGGVGIFPLTVLGCRLMGRPSMRVDNPLGKLGMQVAFTVPIVLPVVGAAALYKLNWFYPAFMVVLGAHYLPFVFLYGMRMFYVVGGLLIGLGLMIGLYYQQSFSLGAWLTSGILFGFAVAGYRIARIEEQTSA